MISHKQIKLNKTILFDRPKTVKERMLCHAIIGKASGKEKVMKTDISIVFISPLLDFSTKQVMFRVDKVKIIEKSCLAEQILLAEKNVISQNAIKVTLLPLVPYYFFLLFEEIC